MKMRRTTANGLYLDKCYLGHDLEQNLRGFSHQSDILENANASGTVIFKL